MPAKKKRSERAARFAEVYRKSFQGEMISVRQLAETHKEHEVLRFDIKEKSKYGDHGPYVIVQYRVDGQLRYGTSASKSYIDDLLRAREQFGDNKPFVARIGLRQNQEGSAEFYRMEVKK